MPSVDDAVNDPTAFPMLYVFKASMPIEGTIVFTVLVMTLLLGGNISYQASTARQTFAFARDHGFPFSSWVGKVRIIGKKCFLHACSRLIRSTQS